MSFILRWFFPPKEVGENHCDLTIEDACSLVDSGDIILVSGTSLSSNFVTLFTASQWSHIGIVYRDPSDIHRGPLIFESIKNDDDGSPNVDIYTHKVCEGVRLIDMATFLKNFSGNTIAIRILLTPHNINIRVRLREHFTRVLADLIKAHHGKPYEERPVDFFLSRYHVVMEAGETFDSFFCSELVALCYIVAGLIPYKHVCATQFLPDDFSETGSVSALSYPRILPPVGIPYAQTYRTASANIIRFSKELYVQVGRSSCYELE